jgi:hypothetical protein
MRISKMLSAVCAAVICAGVTAVRAQDTPAQAAALAALKQKMGELDTQAGQPTNPSLQPVVVTPSAMPPRQPSPPVAPPVTPAPVLVSDNSDFFTPVPPPSHPGVQAALPEKMPETKPQPAPPIVKTPAATNATPAKAVAAKTTQPKAAKTTAKASSPKTKSPAATNAAPAKVVAATQPQPKATKKADAKPAVAPAPAKKAVKAKSKGKPAAKPAKPDETVYPGRSLGFNPIAPPPPPVSAEQQAALRSLLDRYMANEITPDQYQAERKKILAGQ